jgi:hypothetical protein
MLLGLVCTPNPCANGGTCEARPNGVFHCICTPEYEGLRCEFRMCFLRKKYKHIYTVGFELGKF